MMFINQGCPREIGYTVPLPWGELHFYASWPSITYLERKWCLKIVGFNLFSNKACLILLKYRFLSPSTRDWDSPCLVGYLEIDVLTHLPCDALSSHLDKHQALESGAGSGAFHHWLCNLGNTTFLDLNFFNCKRDLTPISQNILQARINVAEVLNPKPGALGALPKW